MYCIYKIFLDLDFVVYNITKLKSSTNKTVHYFPDATEEEAYEILKMCVKEVHRRLFVSLPNFQVSVVNREGIKVLPVINSELLK